MKSKLRGLPAEKFIEAGEIKVFGAREHNLANFDLSLPRNRLIVVTGLSGSGKSSLAFDTLYAEGQRRYMETFQAYVRQFLGHLTRPDVDKIEGLNPVISIEQKRASKNPRSTVGTITEIYDFLRLLYARASEAYSYISGKKMVRFSDREILEIISKRFRERSLWLLSPLVKGRKGHYREMFEYYRKMGFTNVRIDGKVKQLEPGMKVGRYNIHDIELLVDRVKVNGKSHKRIESSVQTALRYGKGTIMILDKGEEKIWHFSRNLMCPDSGISYEEPEPNTFSFNSPYGYCPECRGTGRIYDINEENIIPDRGKSIMEGAVEPLGKNSGYWLMLVFNAIAREYKFSLNTPVSKIPRNALDVILYGREKQIKIKDYFGKIDTGFKGLMEYFHQVLKTGENASLKRRLMEAVSLTDCPSCQGFRLNNIALNFKIDGKHIGEVAGMQLNYLKEWIDRLQYKFKGNQKRIAGEILQEIRTRTGFLLDVGLEYLSLNRPAYSLSGGEAQRIRLATQVGSQLINVLYILDEPSIGLHQRDNHRLTESLKALRDTGNTVIVVEHDRDMMLQADHLLDLGPLAGKHGGKIVSQGVPEKVIRSDSLTAKYLRGEKQIRLPAKRRKRKKRKYLEIRGTSGHNLKNLNVKFPLQKLICVTGVSGSGKSTLINETVYPVLKQRFYRSIKNPLPYKTIKGLEHLDKVIEIDQSPIGRTPRSNPVTYTNVFTHIRQMFAELPAARVRGYKPGRFSFNVSGGRCEECKGAGVKTIEMNFLPDVYVECPSCMGRRYNRETLEVRYKGKSISDVLDMTLEEALAFFKNIPVLQRKIQTLVDVGLGYVHLGQPSTTLSGGEAQRIKLSSELAKTDTGKTFYIFDEPTTGLHFEDIRILMNVLNKLVEKGNTVLIIEHNMDVVKLADHVIDLGPEGGDKGGKVVAEGTPEEVARQKKGHTARFLKKELEETLRGRTMEVIR